MSDKVKKERVLRCILAIHDLGTRQGATAKGVSAALAKEGFTKEEIAEAIKVFTP